MKGIEIDIMLLERQIDEEHDRISWLRRQNAASQAEIAATAKRVQALQFEIVDLTKQLDDLRVKTDELILPAPRDPTQG